MLNDADSISTRNHDAALHLGKVVLHLSTNADYPFAHPNTRDCKSQHVPTSFSIDYGNASLSATIPCDAPTDKIDCPSCI